MKYNHSFLNIKKLYDTDAEELDFVIPSLLVGTVGSIISPGGTGKSAFALQLCCQVAGGTSIFGKNKQPAKSVYLSGEDGKVVLHQRMKAIFENANDAEKDNIIYNLKIADLEQEKINVMDIGDQEFLEEACAHTRLCIIDTLRVVHNLDENNSGDMTELVSVLRKISSKTKCAIVFLHHTSKASMKADADDQTASRGSSVLTDNIRWQAYLRTISEKKAKNIKIPPGQRKYFVEFGVSKQNYGKPIDQIILEKVSGKVGYTLKGV